MKILYVDISLLGHRVPYLKALTERDIDCVALLPENCPEILCRQLVMTSRYEKKRNIVSYFRWILEIRKIVKNNNIDIVHFLCGDALYRFFGLFLEMIPASIVVTYHHMLFSKVRNISLRNIFKKSDMGVVHTDHLKNSLSNIGISNVVKIEYPVFMNCELQDPLEAKRKLSLPSDRACIVVLGGTKKYKGLNILLTALKSVKVPFYLYITGAEGEFSLEYIKQEVADYADSVGYCMRKLNNEEYNLALAATDILVLPYRWEFDGASGPMIEGVWNRKYIVGSSHGSMGEIIRKYNLGKTFKTEDPEDLARVLNEVLQSKRIWSDAAEAFRKNLTVDEFVKHNDEIYELI